MTTTKITTTLRQNTTLIVLGVIVIAFVVGIIVLYMGWRSADAEQSDLKTEQTRAQVNLIQTSELYNLETLREREADLEGNPFPPGVSIVALSSFLATGAERYGVTTVSVTPASSSSVALVITGTVSKMNSFLTYLESGQFVTLKLESLDFTQTGGKFSLVIATRP